MYKTIPIQYLDQWLEQGYNGRIIDLRSPSSYCQGHISGAENYPFDELMDDPDLLDGSCPLLFYCTRGSESMLVCNLYYRKGYQAVNVANGLRFYRGKYLTDD